MFRSVMFVRVFVYVDVCQQLAAWAAHGAATNAWKKTGFILTAVVGFALQVCVCVCAHISSYACVFRVCSGNIPCCYVSLPYSW